MDSRSAVQLGDRIAEKYIVEAMLGAGGMGCVVAARDEHFDTRVAIKLIHADLVRDPDAVERFAREARAMARLKSRHCARVVDVGTTAAGIPFMVMERLDGETLAALLTRRGPLPATEVADYILQACEAIIEAHEAGIVHRDLKPQNLFVSVEGNPRASFVRVLDFGLAKVAQRRDGAREDSGLTQPSDLIGTIHYMAPEQIRDARGAGPSVDVWAIGACLYRLLSGAYPFPASNAAAICGQILGAAPTPIQELRPDIPAPLALLVERCLRKAPEERPLSVRELAAELAAVHEALTRPVPEPAPRPRPLSLSLSQDRGYGMAVGAGIAIACLLLAPVVYVLTSPRSTEPTPAAFPPPPALPDTLEILDQVAGNGALAMNGDTVRVSYSTITGVRSTAAGMDEIQLTLGSSSAVDAARVHLSTGIPVECWDDGLRGMRVGGKRRLTIPREISQVPLKFFVELVEIVPSAQPVAPVQPVAPAVTIIAVPPRASVLEKARSASMEGRYGEVRQLLEGRVRSGHSQNSDEVRLLREACKAMHDLECVQDIKAKYP